MFNYGKPLYPNLQYCKRCCMPETNEGMRFDEMGICLACQSAEQKIHINWAEREKEFRKLLEEYKRKAGDNYDCVVGISGGKDSTFQLHVLTKVYGMNPLAVTFSHNWYSETGLKNLKNAIEKFNVDHMMFTPRRDVVNKLAKKSLSAIGDACWHCHAGVGAFVVQTAVRYNIPLIVWGESTAHASGRSTHYEKTKYSPEYIYGSVKVPTPQMVGDGLTLKELQPYLYPSLEDYNRVGIVGIFLSDYIFWDDEKQTEFVRDVYGWQEDDVEGTYKGYKSVECKMAGVHDYAKFIKRGFGRGTDHASQDVRAGLLTREEGFELAKKYDTERPPGLDYYLKITGITEEEFVNTLKSKREGKAKELP